MGQGPREAKDDDRPATKRAPPGVKGNNARINAVLVGVEIDEEVVRKRGLDVDGRRLKVPARPRHLASLPSH